MVANFNDSIERKKPPLPPYPEPPKPNPDPPVKKPILTDIKPSKSTLNE